MRTPSWRSDLTFLRIDFKSILIFCRNLRACLIKVLQKTAIVLSTVSLAFGKLPTSKIFLVDNPNFYLGGNCCSLFFEQVDSYKQKSNKHKSNEIKKFPFSFLNFVSFFWLRFNNNLNDAQYGCGFTSLRCIRWFLGMQPLTWTLLNNIIMFRAAIDVEVY